MLQAYGTSVDNKHLSKAIASIWITQIESIISLSAQRELNKK